MKTYACVRTDNMSGTVEGKNLVSLKYNGDIELDSIRRIKAFEKALNCDLRIFD